MGFNDGSEDVDAAAAMESLREAARHRMGSQAHGCVGLGMLCAGAACGVAISVPLSLSLSLITAGGMACVMSLFLLSESAVELETATLRWKAIGHFLEENGGAYGISRLGQEWVRDYPDATPESVNWRLWPWSRPFVRRGKR